MTSCLERRPPPSQINRNVARSLPLPTTLYNFTDNSIFSPQNLIPRFGGNTLKSVSRAFQPGITLQVIGNKSVENLAEREGFEPPIPVMVCPLSRRIVSTAHAPLRRTAVATSGPRPPWDRPRHRPDACCGHAARRPHTRRTVQL